MEKLKIDRLVSKVILCVISLAAFIFAITRLASVSLPSGRAPIFFAGATNLLKGSLDIVSGHPFSVLTGSLSFAFKLGMLTSLKLAASLVVALASITLYLTTRLLDGDEITSLLAAFMGVFSFLNLAWAGDYHSILGFALFMVLVRQLVLHLKEEKAETLLPLIAVSVLFLIDFLLASALVAMVVACSAYLFVTKKRLPIDLTSLATVLFFVALTLYGINKEWLTIASMAMFKSSPLTAFSEESWKGVPLALSFLGAIAGLIYLYVKRRLDEFLIGLSLTAVGVCSVFIGINYAIPLFLPLALLPLKLLKQSYTIDRETENGDIVVINIRGEKVFSALLSVITIISLLNYGCYIAIDSPTSYVSDQDLYDLMNVADWMKTNLTEPGLVATPTHLAPLFEGFLGPRVLSWRDRQNPLIADAVNETCFRIITPHLLLDEFEPLSTSKAPLISAYNGNQYVSLLYIEDSYTELKMADGAKEFFESLYGATFINHSISEDERFVELNMEFSTSNARISKTIRTSKFEPSMTITYEATSRTDVHIEEFVLALWVDWGKGIAESVSSGSKVFIVLGSIEGHYSLELDFINVSEEPIMARSATGQEFIKGTFESEGETVKGEVEIRVTSSSPNQVNPTVFSVFDLPKTKDVSYILVTNSSLVLSGVSEEEYEVFYVDDSFAKFSFTYDYWNYTEAPAYGKVTNETFLDGNTARSVTYETAGLTIRKDLTLGQNNLTLFYYVEAANSSDPTFQGLINASLEIWIPWERNIESWSYNGTGTSVSLDVAVLHLRTQGDLLNSIIGPHPEYGQQRVLLTFNLTNPDKTTYNATIGVTIFCDSKELTMRYFPTSRPKMEGSDLAKLYVKSKPFEELYSSGKYVLLEVLTD